MVARSEIQGMMGSWEQLPPTARHGGGNCCPGDEITAAMMTRHYTQLQNTLLAKIKGRPAQLITRNGIS
jgi:hypothetical protein